MPDQEIKEARTDPLLGTTVDRYRIVEKIGEGGMGTVYAVEHVLLRKRMAMKVLRGEFGRDSELVSRFQNEAVAASSIGQENIVSVTDFGWTESGLVYLIMEELQGLSLAQAIFDQGCLPVDRALELSGQICKAFAAAHAAGIVHRDLKPDNIFLTRRAGQTEFVKVLDFGISKVVEQKVEGDRLTKSGIILGTPEYMSPEQSAGKPLDHRTDIYSWGVVLFEMLTGKLPFEADNAVALLMKHQTEPPATFESVRPDLIIPPEAERIVGKALAKSLTDRYQSMDDCFRDVEACRAELAAPLVSNKPPAPKPARPAAKVAPTPPPARPPATDGPKTVAKMEASPAADKSALPLTDRLQLIKSDLRHEQLTPEEGFLASRLIGLTPTVEELLQTSGMGRPEALDIVQRLLGKGIIARRSGSIARPPPPGSPSARVLEQQRDQERRERTKENPFVSRFVRKQVIVQRGRDALSKGQLKEGLQQLRTASALDTRDPELAKLIDDTQGRIDQGEAERLFQEGMQAEAAKDFATALDRFRKAMELRPSNGRYVERVARKLLYDESVFSEAKKLADRAVQLLPNDADARATLARAYLQAGLKGKAKRELELVLELNKEHKFAKAQMAQMKRLRWWGDAG